MDFVMRTGTGTSQSDISVSRISLSTFASIPSKNTQGRPIQVWVDRQLANPSINVWPVPDQSGTYTFVYWKLRRLEDAGNGINTQDVPFRFLPCLVAGLAYYLAMKLPDAMPRIEMLKASYEEQWKMAADEDREKADIRLAPRISY